jgi:hypothetical protein
MRNITRQVVAAFVEGRRKSSGNTRTDGRTLLLHGNEIARRGTVREVEINLAGWDTPTTRDRLRGLGVWVGFQLYREGGQTWLVDGRAGRYAMPSEGWVGVVARNPEGLRVAEEPEAYGLPVTGEPCGCRRGLERDNCPNCEGTGRAIDWRAYHAAKRARHGSEFGRLLCICAGVDPDEVEVRL